ncbi:hypothetical protein EIJ81_00475 (plasmid) [Aliivibrio salmonicida]|uniref:hypothetical protein n=1 Tax=Aliivibrio salmonicida TaxID=40269 RepID=UPI000F70F2E2|nr:hypothetical protein [Aliivibrio salmonicida]AZL83374.1 hypothetical protein EIJ81_00475 [Aliivibrio salmonicida]
MADLNKKKQQTKSKQQNPLINKSKRTVALKGLEIQDLELLILEATEILDEKIKIKKEQMVENDRQVEMINKLLEQAVIDGVDINVLKKRLS